MNSERLNSNEDDQENLEDPIEREAPDDTIRNEVPFNPKDISISIVPRTIGQIVEALEFSEIRIPKYQRLPDLWNTKKKSRFIESLMLNLPIPAFYVDEDEDKIWHVIDGLQRISALDHFILGGNSTGSISGFHEPMKLVDLEFRPEYNGMTWAELPKDIQRRIARNQITVNVIGKGTPDIVKYNIFSRINQGSLILQPQEIRTALFQGPKIEFLEKLVSLETNVGVAFNRATDYSIHDERQQDLDIVTRFVSFYLIDFRDYEPDMDTFLNKGTQLIPTDEQSQQSILNVFSKSMVLAREIFGRHAFRKFYDRNDRQRPINRPLFEIVSVNFAKLTDSRREQLISNKENFINEFILLLNTTNFHQSITNGTATKDRVRLRHSDFIKLLNTNTHDSQS